MNVQSAFTNLLHSPLHLEGQWEVGLTSISLNKFLSNQMNSFLSSSEGKCFQLTAGW